MEWIHYFFNLFRHLDQVLADLLKNYGAWTYLILFVVIFCETGLVVTPFLPGDSLIFAAGAFATQGLNPWLLFVLLSIAAIAGDTVNYWIGHYIGPKAFTGKMRFLKKEYLERTHRFYEKYGGKTIILARFVPIIRTFAPFVAGIGAMNYARFIVYNIVGGVAWVALFLFAGYSFAGQEWVKRDFHWVILAIIIISVMPMVIEYLRSRRNKTEESNP
ncbi:MAG: DedA family protein [Thermoguttaceae bacterium]